jgi:putative FmdB family regulatory protein
VDGRRRDAHHWQSLGESASPARPTRSARTVPTYQYACTNPDAKHQFEMVQSFTDAPVSECPECGSAVRKVYGSVGVVFKGSGFYRTDSRTKASSSESSSSSNGTKDGGTKDGGTKDGGKKDAAPAAASTSSSSSSGSGSSSSSAAAS